MTQQLHNNETAKPAAPSVTARHAETLAALPFSDTTSFADAARGFLGTRPDASTTSAQGRTVWSLEPYAFLAEAAAPDTVNPSRSFPLLDTMKPAAVLANCHQTRRECGHVITHL